LKCSSFTQKRGERRRTSSSENRKLIKDPVTKKGPNGILDFSPFFFHKISMMPMPAPVKNATYKAKNVDIGPRISPIIKASFTSPSPIPRPRVAKKIIRKNKNAKIPVAV